jgi:hypothetical protein
VQIIKTGEAINVCGLQEMGGEDWKTVKDEINNLDLRFKWMLIAV